MERIKTRLRKRAWNSSEYDVVESFDECSPCKKSKSPDKLGGTKSEKFDNKIKTRSSGGLVCNSEEKMYQIRLHQNSGQHESVHVPIKRQFEEKMEKENKSVANENVKSILDNHKSKKILINLPLPSSELNAKGIDNEEDAESNSNDELDEMFLQLKKSGIKTVKSPQKFRKDSPKISFKDEKTLTPKRKISSVNNCISSIPSYKSCKKNLTEEFLDSPKNKVTSFSSPDKKIPELEKDLEDLILNYKRISKKVNLEIEETPKTKKRNPTTPSRRSSIYKSVISKDAEFDIEKTPTRRPSITKSKEVQLESEKTPVRRSSRISKECSSSTKKNINEDSMCKSTGKLPRTPLEKARVSLHVSTVPDSLPCRENEYNNILTFLENKLWDGIGGCMYISGVPGTGKTATVTQVIKYLQEASKDGKVPEFKFVEINGMRLADPRQAYVELWQKLFNKNDKISSSRAFKILDDWFNKCHKKNANLTTILLVDELDLICTKKQDVVYNLLDWPTRTHSRLVVLTIANTMDMPERLFKGRVTSRMGLTRLTFVPYTHKQLEVIVLARLNGLDAFVTDAVRLVTRKVAAVSGDARRALDICRRATELPGPNEVVKISHIEQAIKEMTNSNIVKIIRNCCEMEKLFLRSLRDVSFQSNVDEVDLREVIDQLNAICVLEGIPRPCISSVLSVSNRLKCSRLIFTNQSNAGILQRLTLNVTHDDIHYAFLN